MDLLNKNKGSLLDRLRNEKKARKLQITKGQLSSKACGRSKIARWETR
jgi:hypothetical protein